MKKYSVFILVMLLVVLQLSCSFSLNRSRAAIVYQAVDEDGMPLPELVVIDTTGKELRRIELPEDTGRLFGLNTLADRFVIYQDPTENRRFYRVDTQSGSYEEYAEFGEDGSAYVCSYSPKWVLFCGKSTVHLLNIDSGKLSALPFELDPDQPSKLVFLEIIRPDYKAMALRVGNKLWFVQVDSPEDARMLGDAENMVIAPYFTDGGKKIVYTFVLKAGEKQIQRENLDGSDQEILLSGEDILWGAPVPKHDQLLVVRKGSINLLSLKDGNETELFETEDIVHRIYLDAEGEHAAVQRESFKTKSTQWTFLDLKEMEASAIDEMEGLQVSGRWIESPWLFAFNPSGQDAGNRVCSLNLTSGEVRTQLETDESDNIQFLSFFANGKAILVMQMGQKTRYWLVPADQDEAIRLTDRLVGFTLSPDGKWMVINAKQDSEDQKMPQILLIENATGQEKELGKGFSPLWVEP